MAHQKERLATDTTQVGKATSFEVLRQIVRDLAHAQYTWEYESATGFKDYRCRTFENIVNRLDKLAPISGSNTPVAPSGEVYTITESGEKFGGFMGYIVVGPGLVNKGDDYDHLTAKLIKRVAEATYAAGLANAQPTPSVGSEENSEGHRWRHDLISDHWWCNACGICGGKGVKPEKVGACAGKRENPNVCDGGMP